MRGLSSMIYERKGNHKKGASNLIEGECMSMSSDGHHHHHHHGRLGGGVGTLGLRRTTSGSGVRQRTSCAASTMASTNGSVGVGMSHSSSHANLNMNMSNHNNNNNNNNNNIANTARSKLFDALAHPAHAVAAAAAVGSQPVRVRGQKRRKACRLVVLTMVCFGVVHYSGTMYDQKNHLQQQHNGDNNLLLTRQHEKQGPNNKRSLRSRSPSEGSTSIATPTERSTDGAPLSGLTAWVSQRYSSRRGSQQQQLQLRKNNNNSDHGSSSSSLSSSPIIISASVLESRIQHAIQAAFVADAASMGTHWIYNPDDLKLMLFDHPQTPEFRNPPAPQFYSSREFPGHYKHGQFSPYGEQLWFVTQYVSQQLAITTNKDNEHADPRSSSLMEPMSQAMQHWAETFGGRADQATLEFLSCRRKRLHALVEEGLDVHAKAGAIAKEKDNPNVNEHNYKQKDQQEEEEEDSSSNSNNNNNKNSLLEGACGAKEDQAHFFLKVIPMTCLYVGHPHRRHYVEQAIRVHQNHDQAVLFGLALSDLLERVLLMKTSSNDDHNNDNTNTNTNENNSNNNHGGDEPSSSSSSSSNLREALDATLQNLQEEHTDGWANFALSLTQHHQQHDALVDAWTKARDNANVPIPQLAGQVGRSCNMPGALILTLQALYRVAQLDTHNNNNSNTNSGSVSSVSPGTGTDNDKPSTSSMRSSLGHLYRSYDYYVKALLGIRQAPSKPRENTQLVSAVRENILAAGDTCSRAIYMGAVLGAAHGPPPDSWWNQLDDELAHQVTEAADIIAHAASRRLAQEAGAAAAASGE